MTARARGFTLIEVVVAFAIFAVTAAAVMRAAGDGLSMSTVAARHSIATLIAESKLAAVGVETPLAEGESDGRVDGAYDWRTRVAATEIEQPDEDPTGTGSERVQPYAIEVTVAWRDGGRERSVTLRTVRLARVEETRRR